MDSSHSRNGSYMTSAYQVSIPEGTTANRVPMTVSKSRLQQIKHITNNKGTNNNCTNLMKSKFMSLSPIGGPQKSFQIQ